jgi:hypothetical protein
MTCLLVLGWGWVKADGDYERNVRYPFQLCKNPVWLWSSRIWQAPLTFKRLFLSGLVRPVTCSGKSTPKQTLHLPAARPFLRCAGPRIGGNNSETIAKRGVSHLLVSFSPKYPSDLGLAAFSRPPPSLPSLSTPWIRGTWCLLSASQ